MAHSHLTLYTSVQLPPQCVTLDLLLLETAQVHKCVAAWPQRYESSCKYATTLWEPPTLSRIVLVIVP
jgi:hypothetical protein